MIVTSSPLIDAKHTGKIMRRMVDKFYLDMAPYAHLSFSEFFDLMKNIPFNPDPDGVELLKRPYYTMNRIGPGGDCDDKSICVASFFKIAGIPWRFVGVGNKKLGESKILLSHVYVEVYIYGKWIPFDTTYGFNIFGKTLHKYDRREIL